MDFGHACMDYYDMYKFTCSVLHIEVCNFDLILDYLAPKGQG